jgi:hypothetical protein
MLFEKLSQYKEAKNTLLDNDRDIRKSASILKKSPSFSDLSEGEIISGLAELKEGLGDNIANFVSGAFGGDISKLKTVLTQMKEQELKFNKEENEIYEEFYRTLQDQKALEKDKQNPSYQDLKNDLESSRNALNTRMKELNKSHDEIFNSLEQRVKDLTKDSNRKKKYFNAQRASDILETRNDRYDKIKAITAKSASRTKELESFFGVSVNQAQNQVAQAQKQANQASTSLGNTNNNASSGSVGDTPQEILEKYKKDYEKLLRVQASQGAKIRSLTNLEDKIFKTLQDNDDSETTQNPFGDLGQDVKQKLTDLMIEIRDKAEEIKNVSSPSSTPAAKAAAKKPAAPKKGNTP